MNQSSCQLIKLASIAWVTIYLSGMLWTQRGLHETDYLILLCLMIPILDGIKFRLAFTPRPELEFQWPLFVTEHRSGQDRRQLSERRDSLAGQWTAEEKRAGLDRRILIQRRSVIRLVS